MSDRLLDTKFFPPPVRDHWVTRARLFQRLHHVFSCRVGLVSAPAGFGKSTLLSDWLKGLAQEKYASAWISLEPSDNDPQRFYNYFIAAWQRIFPRIGAAIRDEMSSFPAPSTENLAIILLNDLVSVQEEDIRHCLLVLDDYHLIENKDIHTFVAYFIEHLPPNIHVILVTRTDPPLPLPRWRSRAYLAELRVDDLRFNPAEAVLFFSKGMQLNLPEDQVFILEERTEGWAVGLQMAALSLQEHKNPHQFVQAFSGTHRYILDYLLEEVINRQAEDVQRFLLESSVLNSLSGPLCDTVLDCEPGASQQMLEKLERENLFIVPLDDERSWYRYHHLFMELLRVRLRQRMPERTMLLYGRAANWHADKGSWREAIDYALQARNMDLAANHFEEAVRTGQLGFLFSGVGPLIERFLPEQIEARPLLGLADAMARIDRSQLGDIDARLRSIEQSVISAPSEDQDQILSMVYAIQSTAALLLGDCDWIISAVREVSKRVPLSNQSGIIALIQLAFAHFFLGDLNQAEICSTQVLYASVKQNNWYTYLATLDGLGRLRYHKGDLLRSEKDYIQGLDIGASYRDRFPSRIGALQRDYADLLREYNQSDKALQLALSSLDYCRKFETISGQGLAYVHLGRILLMRGDLKGALDAYEKADRLCKTHTVYFDLRVIVQEFYTKLCLAQGRPEEAWQGLDECQGEINADHILLQEWIMICRARVLLYKNRPEDAIKLLSGRAAEAAVNGRGRNQLEMLLLVALAGYSIGLADDALKRLAEALRLAQPQGFARIFIDEGAAMARLLQEGLAKQVFGSCSPYARSLLLLFEKPGALAVQPLEGEQLSARELEVLQMICDGRSNQEIAASLYLTIGTVKSHVHHIFGKMGVENRPQAIALARQLGIFGG
jgi:LuxR family transcriptional regulator, maltose regulon positive regulatory protein